MTNRSYKDWELKDFQDYYEKNFSGKSRGQVSKEDGGFYMTVYNKGLLDKVIPGKKRKHRSYKNWTLKDFQEYYNEHYQGKSRKQVLEKDGGFYMTIYNRGLIDDVLLSTKWRWEGFSLKDFQDYYKKNYPGKSRSEILKEDSGFYQVVQRRKFLNSVFPKNKNHVKGNGQFTDFSVEDFQNYYKENYPGKSRSEAFKEDSAFYNAIQRRKLLNSVFPKKKSHTGRGSKGKFSDFSLENFQDYYKENYLGKSKTEVFNEDNRFYYALHRRDLINKVLTKDKRGKEIKSYHNWTIEDFKNFYKENYQGLTRTEISKKDNSFYQVTCKRNLTNEVFSGKRSGRKSKFANFSLKDFQDYYNKNHKGKFLGEVIKRDKSFYGVLCYKSLLDKINIPRKNKKWANFSLEEFQDYYEKNFSGKNRGQVSKEDGGFYGAVYKKNFLEKVIPRKNKK